MHDFFLKPHQIALIREILRRHVPNRTVWAFGSRVRGRVKPFSDLDLAILGDTPLPDCVLAALQDDFADSDLPIRIDIVDWARTSPEFRDIIVASQDLFSQ